ncbi:MAG: tRNA-dihydrouridine synthase, partial [Lachnospiraceae bacterium]|nr:tRNA-dihydrouridine synthase [Lachnospiraceae bacterium]
PVLGNGDVTDAESAAKMFRETGCDGVMIARAAQGNPWIFREILYEIETGKKRERPTPEEIKDMIIRHAGLLLDFKGEYTAIREMRKHISWYTGGIPGSAKFRGRMNEMETMDQLVTTVEELFGRYYSKG